MKRVLIILVLLLAFGHSRAQSVANGTVLGPGEHKLWTNFAVTLISGTDTVLWWNVSDRDLSSWSGNVVTTGITGEGYGDWVVGRNGSPWMIYSDWVQDTITSADDGLSSSAIEDYIFSWGSIGYRITKGTFSAGYFDIYLQLNERE